MSGILHNPENDSYGFRVITRPITSQDILAGRLLDPNVYLIKRIRQYICDQGWHEDIWYETIIPKTDERGSLTQFDFWFATREMALITKLTVS